MEKRHPTLQTHFQKKELNLKKAGGCADLLKTDPMNRTFKTFIGPKTIVFITLEKIQPQ
jgi:hypothetical protein